MGSIMKAIHIAANPISSMSSLVRAAGNHGTFTGMSVFMYLMITEAVLYSPWAITGAIRLLVFSNSHRSISPQMKAGMT